MQNVVYEALRFSAPVPQSTEFTLSQDTTIGRYKIKAGEDISINMIGLHFHKDQWQQPREFLPDRFDNSNPLSLTPDGQKRNPFAWLPFNGGKRSCLGKTFADNALKTIGIYLTTYFDFKLLDSRWNSKEFPILMIGMSETIPIMVELTSNSD